MAGSAKRVVGTLLFLIALVAVLAFYFVVFAGANQVSGVPGTDDLGMIAIGVSALLGIVFLTLFIMLVARRRKRARRQTEKPVEEAPYFLPPEEVQEMVPAFEDVGDDMVVYDVWTLPTARRAWGGEEEPQTFSFYFPLNVESGVYVNDYIRIDGGNARLKLRTLLAGPSDVGAASFVVPAKQEEDWGDDAPDWEAAPAKPVAPAAPAPRSTQANGGDFMTELERRFEEEKAGRRTTTYTRTRTTRSTTSQVAPTRREAPQSEAAYYDFKGDDHPVIDVEGIGTVYAQKLQAQGVETTGRLCYESSVKLSKAMDVPVKTIETWQAMAQLMKVNGIGPQYAEALARSGIGGIDELKRRSASRIADQVNEYLGSLETTVLGTKITERRVAGWQEAASTMRRVRQTPPQK